MASFELVGVIINYKYCYSDVAVFDDAVVQQALQVTTAKTIVLYTGGSASLPGNWSNAPAILICFGPGQE